MCASEDVKSKVSLTTLVTWGCRLFGFQKAKIHNKKGEEGRHKFLGVPNY